MYSFSYLVYAGQEATVRTGHGTTDCFQIGKGVRQGCILSPCLFNLYEEYIMRNAGLDPLGLLCQFPHLSALTLWAGRFETLQENLADQPQTSSGPEVQEE